MFRHLLIFTVVSIVFKSSTAAVSLVAMKAMDFEVFGRVQEVFFRKVGNTRVIPLAGVAKSVGYGKQSMSLLASDFEVFGTVQGVYFRVYTKEQANRLGLRGWCKNTSNGTVLGHMQGPSEKVETMKHWLKTTGSPSSKIDKAEFRNQKDIPEFTFDDFGIIRDRD